MVDILSKAQGHIANVNQPSGKAKAWFRFRPQGNQIVSLFDLGGKEIDR